MPSPKAKDFRSKEDKELKDDAENLRKEMFDLRLKAMSEGVQNPSRFQQIRRQIAQMQTVLRERGLKIRGQQPR